MMYMYFIHINTLNANINTLNAYVPLKRLYNCCLSNLLKKSSD